MKKKGQKDSRIRYAVVGLGHIAQEAVLPAFRGAKKTSVLAALVSGTPTKIKKLSRAYRVPLTASYEEYDDLLQSGEVDAVYIALPNSMHLEYVQRAARAGIHVLCEKPLGMTQSECKQMISACEKGGVKLMTAYRLHLDPANLEVLRLIKKGEIGDLQMFSSLFSYQIKDSNIRLEGELGGGALFDIGIYCINAARMVFQSEPTRVFGVRSLGLDKRFREVDGLSTAILEFGDANVAQISCSFAAAPRSYYEVVGTKGSIRVEPAFEYQEPLKFTVQTQKRSYTRKYKQHDQFAAELSYFAEAIQKNKRIEPSGEEGLLDVRVIEAIIQSARTGRAVELVTKEKALKPSVSQKRAPRSRPRKVPLVRAESASGS